MTNTSTISSFWFKVQDAGKELGVTNDLVAYKFLQHVPNGSKVYEKLKETIKTSMMEQDMTVALNEAQNKVSNYSGNIKFKEEVFVVIGMNNIHYIIADLQDQINNFQSNYHGITSDRDPEESSDNTEERDEDDQLYFGGNRSHTKQKMSCKIYKKKL